MKELTILIPSLRGGGLEKSILTLACEIEKRGFDLDFVVVNTIKSAYEVSPSLNFINLNTSRILFAIFPLVKYLRKAKPRVLVSAGTPLNSIAVIARWISGYPKRLILGERNHLSSIVKNSNRFRDKLRPFFVKYLYPKADLIVAVSKSVAEDVVDAGDLDKNKVLIIHNIFDVDNIIAQAKEPIGLSWLDEQNIPTLVNVGRLNLQKDQATLLKAFALVRDKKPCQLIILGEGEERSSLEQLTKDLNISNDIYMPGFVDNPYSYMLRANMLILSSAWEGLPGVLVEALACGTSIVSTDCPGGASEILKNGKYGTLVKPGDPDQIAKAILTVLEKPMATEVLIHRARDFSLKKIIPEYLDIFQLESNES